jgi:hypothetical protein
MRSKDQLTVISLLEQQGTISPRRIDKLTQWENKHTHNILGRLVRIGVLRKVGKPGQPEYRLSARWKSKIKRKPLPVIKQQVLVEVCSIQQTEEPPAENNVICEECRHKWQGYSVHKIFGSGARA